MSGLQISAARWCGVLGDRGNGWGSWLFPCAVVNREHLKSVLLYHKV